jgi:hypothetical protein
MTDWIPIAISLAALLLSYLSYRASRWRQRAADLSISALRERVPIPDAPGMVSDVCVYVVNRAEADATDVRVVLHRQNQTPYAYEEILSVVGHDRHRLTCWWDEDPTDEVVPFTMTVTWADGRRGRHTRDVDVTYVEG